MIHYIKGTVFKAPKGSVLLHACNAKGVWGAGVAREFAKRYPSAYKTYSKHCDEHKAKGDLPGHVLVIPTRDYQIGCLFTSKSYGIFKDKPEVILKNTEVALRRITSVRPDDTLGFTYVREFHLPKINSGVFGVDWKRTEALLKSYPDVEWFVYEL